MVTVGQEHTDSGSHTGAGSGKHLQQKEGPAAWGVGPEWARMLQGDTD